MDVNGDQTQLEPMFHLAWRRLRQAEEASGSYGFGHYVVAGNINENPVTSRDMRMELAKGSDGLANFVIGLGYFSLGRYVEADHHFGLATDDAELDNLDVRRVLYLFRASTAVHLDDLVAATGYYDQALEIDPDYACAQLGKSEVIFLEGRDDCVPEKIDVDKLKAAIDGYAAALTPYGQLEEESVELEIPLKAAYFTTRARVCLAIAGVTIPGVDTNWAQIEEDLTAVVTAYRKAEPDRKGRIAYLVAEAYSDLALVHIRPDPHGVPQRLAGLNHAREAFEEAENLSNLNERKGVFATWQARLDLYAGDCTNARHNLDQGRTYHLLYQQQNTPTGQPNTGSTEVDNGFWRAVNAEWSTRC